MSFQRVRLYRFRNLADGEVPLGSTDVFLVGENGQGKTNFLEALYLLSYGSGFRSRRDVDLCRHGSDELAVDGEYLGEAGVYRVGIRYRDRRKTITVDDRVVDDRRDMIAAIPTVLFRHDDIALVSGTPENQRWFCDQTASMIRAAFVDDLRRYRRILRSRNEALKRHQPDLIDAYDAQLVKYGGAIQQARRQIVAAFNVVFEREYHEISGHPEPLSIEYRPSWRAEQSDDERLARLVSQRDRDLAIGTTTSGPHRDRIEFRYQGADFVATASTGQIRLVSLVLRVAQMRYVAEVTGRQPVLLLDDVLLELDPMRRERFLDRLPDARQRVFTFLPGEPYDAYRGPDTLVYSVRDGTLRGHASG